MAWPWSRRLVATTERSQKKAEELLKTALQAYPANRRTDVVFDVYRDSSIKNAERVKRSASQGVLFSTIVPKHRIKNWRRLLALVLLAKRTLPISLLRTGRINRTNSLGRSCS